MSIKAENKRNEFTQVIDKHRGILFKIANAYCKDPDDQKDLVQEIIIQIWESYHNYDPKYKITTWIYRIALNVAISHYRKSSTRKKYTIPMQDRFVEVAAENEENQEEEIKILRQFIQQLDELNRAMMILYLDGNSHAEIADVLNITKSNVGTKINRIKEKLKKHFNQKQQ
jgi:RNA polymerase sigma factor (sigma-70 family)